MRIRFGRNVPAGQEPSPHILKWYHKNRTKKKPEHRNGMIRRPIQSAVPFPEEFFFFPKVKGCACLLITKSAKTFIQRVMPVMALQVL